MNLLFPKQHTHIIETTILAMLRCYTIPAGIMIRLKAVLLMNTNLNMAAVARELNVSRSFVAKWRDRATHFFLKWPTQTTGIEESWLLIYKAFSDAPRSGSPAVYTAEQFCGVMAIALKEPTQYNREITHWTYIELADEVNQRGIAKGMSKSTVGRFLKQADIRPHRSTYWLNPNIEDDEVFKKEVNNVCDTYHQATERAKDNVITVSVDEKTGIQALERISPTKPMKQGVIEKREFEYKRHGTLSLTPSFNVVTGQIMQHRIAETRGEIDFYEHIKETVALSPESGGVFVADQLNVHKSESLVRYIAKHCGITDELGVKGKSGILKSIASRQAFLTDESHRIRFVFTPKHCSWLNQVEIWFGILSRKLLNRGDFNSMDDLRNKMERFIDYFNKNLAKPLKWTYKDKALSA